MEVQSAPKSKPRDTQLAHAMLLLLSGELLLVIAYALRLATVLDSRVNSATTTASVLDVVSRLPALVGVALGTLAFFVYGGERSRRLRQAFLVAALAFAIDFIGGMFASGGLYGSAPGEFRIGLLIGALSAFGIAAASVVASGGFAVKCSIERRDRRLRWALALAGTAFLLGALSSLVVARAYSYYAGHGQFVQGHVWEAMGTLGTALGAWFAATAFRRPLAERERRLYRAAAFVAASLIATAVGQVLVAVGSTSIGYPDSEAVAGWVFVAVTCLLGLGAAVAGLGFRSAAMRLD